MTNVREHIQQSLKRALSELGIEDVESVVEHPAQESHSDYATSVALVAFKKYQVASSKYQEWKTPMELAEGLVKILHTSYLLPNTCSKVEAAPPGFVNFWLSREFLISRLQDIVEKKESNLQGDTLRSQVPDGTWRNKKIMVEFTDPNPFKEFHVGHLYSNTVGEAICRLLEAQGAVVKRANYQGDVGLHVAKALYGLLKIFNFQFSIFNLEKKPLTEKVRFLGQAYTEGSKAYEEDEEAKEEIVTLNRKIYENDPSIKELYEKGKQWSLEHFETIYKRLGTKFDYYYFESKAGAVGLKLVLEQLKRGVFVKSDGAVIFPGEKYGLHNRVFINSLGLPTYEAKDLGLAPTKYQDFPYDQSIIVTGNEINAYFRVLIEALKRVNPDLGEKTKHLSHGMVRLPTGKMSSRTGEVITGEWLLDEAKRRMQERFSQMLEGTADMVAVGAVKYALLRSTIGKDVTFDIDESINLEGDSGPYLQYTYARTQSVLRKSQAPISKFQTNSKQISNFKLEPEEVILLRTLYRFPEVVEEAAAQFAPNTLCSYLFHLAQKFNLFYQKHPILKPNIPQVSIENHLGGGIDTTPRDFRLILTATVGQVIKNGLRILGIEAPERM